MSKTSDLTYLEAQRAALRAQLDGLAPEQRLMRINLQSRLQEIDDEMAALQAEGALDRRAKAALAFGGRPNGRRFELRLDSTGEIISGRISDSVADPSSLTPYFGARCVAHMWIVTVERAGKEQRTYYLTGVEPLPEGDDSSPE